MSAGPDLVVLSPHLDDGVLSCGGRLAAVAARRGEARVVTVFAGDDPPAPANPLASELRRIWNLPAGGIAAARRAEDREACRRLGVAWEHWDEGEALYRLSGDGSPLYPSVAALYAQPHPADGSTLEAVAERIRALPGCALLLAPLGVGSHVDHLLVRRAAEASGRPIAYYEDFPYVEWKWLALRRALATPRTWENEVLPVPDELFERKVAAILAYASQVPAMFRSEGRLRKQLRRQLRRAGGERLWRPLPPSAGPR